MRKRTAQHLPWCARPPRGCVLGCTSNALHVYADGNSQSRVTAQLWAPLNRNGRHPVAVDLEIKCGHLGRQVVVSLSLGQARLVARNLVDLVELAEEVPLP